ncbi:hypothetical protein FB451DRAFT_1185960 [Mycena latifolia]|nr:hypothetical protein FB451DRAFT_1185960 [Mycena latifolia]
MVRDTQEQMVYICPDCELNELKGRAGWHSTREVMLNIVHSIPIEVLSKSPYDCTEIPTNPGSLRPGLTQMSIRSLPWSEMETDADGQYAPACHVSPMSAGERAKGRGQAELVVRVSDIHVLAMTTPLGDTLTTWLYLRRSP